MKEIIKIVFRVIYLICWVILTFKFGQKCNANIAVQSDWFAFILYTIILSGFLVESWIDDLKEHIIKEFRRELLNIKIKNYEELK